MQKPSTLDFILGIPALICLAIIRDILNFFWRPLVRFFWNFRSLKKRASKQRILIIKFGIESENNDLIPALHSLKKEFKDAHITFLGPSEIGKILMDKKLVNRLEAPSFKVFRELSRPNFMMVIDFEVYARFPAIVASQMKTPTSMGFGTTGMLRHFAQDDTYEYNPQLTMAENNWNLMALGCAGCGHVLLNKYLDENQESRQL